MGWFVGIPPLHITSVVQNNAMKNARYMDGQYGLYYIVQCVL